MNAPHHMRPCAGCPWLRANQTPDAVAASPVDGRGVHWYSAENLRRTWRSVRKIGALLPCHATDVDAPLYGGKLTSATKAYVCAGLTILARREVTAFCASGEEHARYKARGWARMSLLALARWASRLVHTGASWGVDDRRSMTLPDVDATDARVGVPWPDAVLNIKAES